VGGPGPGAKKKEKTDTVRRVGEPLAPRALQPDSNINTLYIYILEKCPCFATGI
jgi:hypothetical protein